MTALEIYHQKQELKKLNFNGLLTCKTFTTDAQARQWLKDITDYTVVGERKNDDGESFPVTKHDQAVMAIHDSLNIAKDYWHGTTSQNSVWNAYTKRAVAMQKAGFTSGLTHTGPQTTIVTEFESDGNELLRDMEWTAAYSMYSVSDSLRAEIVDVINLVTWAEYELTESIRTSAYKQDSATFMYAQRFGGGLAFQRLDLRHPMISLNLAINALRTQAVDNKITQAYANLQAAITAAIAATYDTAVNALGIPHTINLARNTLIQRMANNGFQLSAAQPVELYAHPDHEDIIESAFMGSWYPTSGPVAANAINPIRVKQNTVRRHYTFNLATNLGSGNIGGVLVLPGKDNIWVDFDALRFGQNENNKKDAVEIIGQEYYTQQANTDQFQIFRLA